MLPIERKLKIKELIQERKAMKITELSKAIGVSEMTIHRDIKPLIEEGLIIKSFGGISAVTNSDTETEGNKCDFCYGDVREQLAYRMFLPDDKMITGCCAHCGLMKHQQLFETVTHAICYDLIQQTTISAPSAWYVMDTTLNMGCCEPQILSFKHKEHADKFVTGFGGVVYSFKDAIKVVHEKMTDYRS